MPIGRLYNTCIMNRYVDRLLDGRRLVEEGDHLLTAVNPCFISIKGQLAWNKATKKRCHLR